MSAPVKVARWREARMSNRFAHGSESGMPGFHSPSVARKGHELLHRGRRSAAGTAPYGRGSRISILAIRSFIMV